MDSHQPFSTLAEGQSVTRLMISMPGWSPAGADPPHSSSQAARPHSWKRGFARGPVAVIRCCLVAGLKASAHRLNGSKNTKQNKALQTLKRQSVAGFSFVQINSCTYRLDRPSTLGAGWLMEVAWPGHAKQQWVARVGNQASDPL